MGTLEGSSKIDRYKIGTGSPETLKIKQTSPGIMSMPIGDAVPSRPQAPERMGTGSKRKAKNKHAVAAANARDPAPVSQAIRMPVSFGANDDKTGYTKNRSTALGYKKVGS